MFAVCKLAGNVLNLNFTLFEILFTVLNTRLQMNNDNTNLPPQPLVSVISILQSPELRSPGRVNINSDDNHTPVLQQRFVVSM
jgi:hypothetical protein